MALSSEPQAPRDTLQIAWDAIKRSKAFESDSDQVLACAIIAREMSRLPVSAGQPVAWREALAQFDVAEFLRDYEFRGEGGGHRPDENELALLEDAICGAISEIEQAALAAAPPARSSEETTDNG